MYTVPDLPYEYNALQPAISEAIMHIHHDKHHQAYVAKLNKAIEQSPGLGAMKLVELLANLDTLPDALRSSLRNNAGGHYNHSLFWQCMAPHAGGEPSGDLLHAIRQKYGTYAQFTEQFSDAAANLFGSGWVWLTPDLDILALPNQDSPITLGKGEPLMGLDVWEHAYYLDYANKRDEYIQNWWQVVNWPFVEKRYANVSQPLI